MTSSVLCTRQGLLLVVRVQGTPTLQELCDLSNAAAAEAQQHGMRSVLFDFLDARIQLSFTDHMWLGMHVAHSLTGFDKVATVAQPVGTTGVSEKVVQRSGVPLKAFNSRAEAYRWIGVEESAG